MAEKDLTNCVINEDIVESVESALDTLTRAEGIERQSLYIKDRQNPLEYYSEKEFQRNFAFTKSGFLRLLELFEPALKPIHGGEKSLSSLFKLTTFLQYLRSNGFCRSVGSQCFVQMSEAGVNQIVNAVAVKLANYSSKFIQFPDINEQKAIANRYKI